MKNLVLMTKLLGLMLGVASVVYASKVLINQVRSTKQYSLSVDAYLSEKTQQALTQHLADIGQSLSINTVGQNIKEAFACVRKVDAFMLPSSGVHVEVKAHVPQYRVNETKVATRDGSLISKKWFCPQVVDYLYHIDVQLADDQKILSKTGKHCVSCLSAQLLDEYRFVWEDETHAWLYDKEQPRFALLCDSQSVPDATMIQNCNTVKQELSERGVFERRDKKIWIADVRFAKQVIVFSRG